jgi:hypothetical protein
MRDAEGEEAIQPSCRHCEERSDAAIQHFAVIARSEATRQSSANKESGLPRFARKDGKFIAARSLCSGWHSQTGARNDD